MIGLLVCFGGLLAAGLFFLAADLLRLPYLKTSKAMINTGRENRKAAKSLETYLLSLAVKLAPYIHMDEYKRPRFSEIPFPTCRNRVLPSSLPSAGQMHPLTTNARLKYIS